MMTSNKNIDQNHDSEHGEPLLGGGDPHPVDARSILVLSWPVILTNLLTTAVQWVDLLMVARLGKETVAAVGLGGFLSTLVWATMMALQTGTQILVAQAYGAGNRRSIDRTVQLALLIGFGTSLVTAAVLCFPGTQILHRAYLLFDVDPEVASIGARYLGVALLALPGGAVALVGQAALRAVGDTRTPLWLTGTANVLNAFFNYVLIFGKFGMPELGVVGAAIGTVAARSIEAGLFLMLLYGGRLRVALRPSRFRLDLQTVKDLLRLGLPSSAEQLVMTSGHLIYQKVIASYGTEALAAYQVGVILLQAAFMPGFGFSVAATTLVGQWIGARDPSQAVLATKRCRNLAVTVMSLMGILFFFAAEPFSAWVLADLTVIPIATLFIRCLALAQPMMAVHFRHVRRAAGCRRRARTAARRVRRNVPRAHTHRHNLGLGL